MAYSSTLAAVRKIADAGLYSQLSTDAAMGVNGDIYAYCSSHGSTAVGGVAGFFSACGAQPTSGAGAGILAKSANNVGMRFGALLVNVESSGGAAPGRVTWHAVNGSTFNQSSTSASSAFVNTAGFDISVSSATT